MSLAALLFWVLVGLVFFYIYPQYTFLFYLFIGILLFTWWFVFKKIKHKIFSLYPLLFLIIIYGVIQLPAVQTYLVQKTTSYFSDKLRTSVTVKSVDVRFFNKVLVQGVMVKDLQNDTLLYAGTIQGNVNDWFFLKDNITIENVQLDDVVIKMQRADSVWNYQYLIDFFAQPKSKNANAKDPNIDFKKVQIRNLKLSKKDYWLGEDMTINLKQFNAQTKLINLEKKQIEIKNILLDNLYFTQSDYEGKRPKNNPVSVIMPKLKTKYEWNNDGWNLKLANIDIVNSAYKNDKFTLHEPYINQFDGQHILFENIQGTIKNLTVINDSVVADIKLVAKERSGLQIKKLNTTLTLTPTLMEFKNLNLITNKSTLRDYYAMRYQNLGKDFSNFLEKVNLDAALNNSEIHSDDLAIFAPELAKWKRVIKIDGNAKGTLDNFIAKNLKITTGNTYLEGNLSMHGLPDINSTFIDFESKQFSTSYNEIATFVPEIKNINPPALYKLGSVNFKGNFTGFIRDFVAYGTLNSAIGNLTADVNMKTPLGGVAKYKGKIATTNFKLGSFLDVKDIGNVALNVSIDGVGFGLKDLKEKVSGKVTYFDYGGYRYQNLNVQGLFEKNIFEGSASIADPNLAISNLNGIIDFRKQSPGFKLMANIEKADFKKLGFVKENFLFNGDLDVNFTGNTIDNFLGSAKVSNANLLQANNKLSFDYLNINTSILAGNKSLTIATNELEANIIGTFKILELPNAITLMLAKYYPAYINAPKNIYKNKQNFTYNIKTNNVADYLKLIDKKLSGFNNTTINGYFNLQHNSLALNATIPQFEYDGKFFTNATIKTIGNADTLLADIAVDDIRVNDSFNLPNTKIKLAASNDFTNINLKTSASAIFGNAELNASVQTLTDGIKINFSPSSFIINNKKWQLSENGTLVLRKRFINASEVKFYNNNEAIILRTELDPAGETEDTYLVAELKNIDIEDFAFLLPKSIALKGKVTGLINVADIFGKQNITYKGYADSVYFNNAYVGKVNLDEVKYLSKTKKINYKGKIEEKDFDLAFSGSYNLADTTGNALQNTVNARKLNLSILKPYLSTVFSDIQGFANGDISINTTNSNLTLVGNVIINEGILKVGYTQVRYKLLKQPIIFEQNAINLGKLVVTDTLGNTGFVSGIINHNGFEDFSFNQVQFASPKLVLLNTTKKDNAQFYGRVIGSATMALNGDMANMRMDIKGEPSLSDTSHVYLPTGDSKESNVVDYIEFVQFGKLMKDPTAKLTSNLKINVDLIANEGCKIDVILDETTKDIIQATGNGNLKITVGTNEPLRMSGRYELAEGNYTYNFQNFVNKPFKLVKGGSIAWNGDPLAANLDIYANYLAYNVDLSILKSGANTSLGNGIRELSDIIVESHITGLLKSPSIRFQFGLPISSEYNKDDLVIKKLADFRNDDNETIKQAASLLLLNQFISTTQGFSASGTFSLATSTIGGYLSSVLTNLANSALNKATNGKLSIDIGVNSSLNVQEQASQLQANLRAKFKYEILKNLRFSFGGNIDYNNPLVALYGGGGITPDFSLEWLINKDGSLRVVGFNRTSVDINAQRNRTGVELGYRKDVDRFGDIFRSKKRIAILDSIEKDKPVVKRKK